MVRSSWRRLIAVTYAGALIAGGLWLVARVAALGYVHATVVHYEKKYGLTDPEYNNPGQWSSEPSHEEDGGPLYRAAAELVPPGILFDAAWKTASEKGDASSLHALIAKMEPSLGPAIDLMDLAARRSGCDLSTQVPQDDGHDFGPSWNSLRALARYRLVEARLGLLEGDLAEFSSGLDSTLALAGCAESEPSFYRLLGGAMEREVFTALQEAWLSGAEFSQAELDRLEKRVAGLPTLGLEPTLRFFAVLMSPRNEEWSTSPNRRALLARLLALPALDQALALAAFHAGLDSLSAAEPMDQPFWWRAVSDRGPWLAPTYWQTQRVSEARMSRRSLILAALRAEREVAMQGAYPASGPPGSPTPGGLVAEAVVWRREVDGALDLSLPRTERRWSEIVDSHPMLASMKSESTPLWSIRLPAPVRSR